MTNFLEKDSPFLPLKSQPSSTVYKYQENKIKFWIFFLPPSENRSSRKTSAVTKPIKAINNVKAFICTNESVWRRWTSSRDRRVRQTDVMVLLIQEKFIRKGNGKVDNTRNALIGRFMSRERKRWTTLTKKLAWPATYRFSSPLYDSL